LFHPKYTENLGKISITAVQVREVRVKPGRIFRNDTRIQSMTRPVREVRGH
jgi:hypothetical protein